MEKLGAAIGAASVSLATRAACSRPCLCLARKCCVADNTRSNHHARLIGLQESARLPTVVTTVPSARGSPSTPPYVIGLHVVRISRFSVLARGAPRRRRSALAQVVGVEEPLAQMRELSLAGMVRGTRRYSGSGRGNQQDTDHSKKTLWHFFLHG